MKLKNRKKFPVSLSPIERKREIYIYKEVTLYTNKDITFLGTKP